MKIDARNLWDNIITHLMWLMHLGVSVLCSFCDTGSVRFQRSGGICFRKFFQKINPKRKHSFLIVQEMYVYSRTHWILVIACLPSPLYFQPGAMVPKRSCEDCVCTDEQDIVTRTNRIQCVPVKCQTTCQQVSAACSASPAMSNGCWGHVL